MNCFYISKIVFFSVQPVNERNRKFGPVNLIYKAQFCLSVYLSVCFNSSETTRGTSIKLGTNDHHYVVSVIKGIGDVMMTS